MTNENQTNENEDTLSLTPHEIQMKNMNLVRDKPGFESQEMEFIDAERLILKYRTEDKRSILVANKLLEANDIAREASVLLHENLVQIGCTADEINLYLDDTVMRERRNHGFTFGGELLHSRKLYVEHINTLSSPPFQLVMEPRKCLLDLMDDEKIHDFVKHAQNNSEDRDFTEAIEYLRNSGKVEL